MGWQGAPATFQRATDLLLRGMSHATVLAYIDDIIVFSKTFHGHVAAVVEVCKRLHTAGRAVKLSKVHWAKEEVEFLGFKVGKGVISPIQNKVQNVLKLEDPTSSTALLSFIGAAGVYRNFIPDFATLADPLYKCESRKEEEFADRWSVECTAAVQHIRVALERMTSMVLPHGNAELALQVDCDQRGFGSVLLQRMTPAYPWMPMKFYSGVFRGPDARRSNPERIVMAVARVLKKIHPLLPYSKKIQVFTSDDAVGWALDPKEVSGRSAKAALAVSEFDVTWSKAKGKYQRFGGLFSYNSPDLQARQRAAERRKVESQQRCTQLDQCEVVTLPDAWVLTFDGGYRRKDNIGGRGWTVWSVVDDEWTLCRAAGSYNKTATTSNVEEFTGLCESLECIQHLPARPTHVFGDSKLVIGAMQGKLNCKAPGLVPLWERAKAVASSLIEVHFWQVSRDFNTAADWLANQSMDQQKAIDIFGEDEAMGVELNRLHGTSLHERIYSRPVLQQKDLPQRIMVVTRAQARARRAQSDAFGRLMPWERLRHSQLATPWIRACMEFIEKGIAIPDSERGELAAQHFAVNDGVLWLTSSRADEEWRLVIPPKLRNDILAEFHEGRGSGHLKGQRFHKKVRDRYYWPRMAADIKHYSDSCVACQLTSGQLSKRTVPLSCIHEVTTRPFQCIAVDSVVNLPLTERGNRYIVVMVDLFTRHLMAVPVPDLSVATYVDCVLTSIIAEHGCPERLISDQGGQFIGNLATAVYEAMRIRKQGTTAYHPMSNGLVERMNATVVNHLKAMCMSHPSDWDRELKWFVMAYRTSVHRVTQCTPFELVHGRECRLPYDVMMREYKEPQLATAPRAYLRQMLSSIGEQRARVRELTEESRVKDRERYASKAKLHEFAEGEQVWLYYPVIPPGVTKKLWVPWRGPFRVSCRVSDTLYKLELPEGCRIRGTVSANRLRPFIDRARWPDTIPSDIQEADPIIVPEDCAAMVQEEIGPPTAVRRILDERRIDMKDHTSKKEFLVDLRMRSGHKVTRWVPEAQLSAGDLIQEYRSKIQRARQATLPEGTPEWEYVDPIGVVAMDLDLKGKGMTTCGMSETRRCGNGMNTSKMAVNVDDGCSMNVHARLADIQSIMGVRGVEDPRIQIPNDS